MRCRVPTQSSPTGLAWELLACTGPVAHGTCVVLVWTSLLAYDWHFCLHSSFTGLFFLIRFPVSYSRFGNAKKMLTSLNQEDFVNPLGACGLVDKGGWWVGPSSISFLEFVVIRPWKIMYEKNW